jgi:hypothetical protein
MSRATATAQGVYDLCQKLVKAAANIAACTAVACSAEVRLSHTPLPTYPQRRGSSCENALSRLRCRARQRLKEEAVRIQNGGRGPGIRTRGLTVPNRKTGVTRRPRGSPTGPA